MAVKVRDIRLNERRLKYLMLTRPYIVQHHQLLSQSLRRKKKAEKQNRAKQTKNKLKQRKKNPVRM